MEPAVLDDVEVGRKYAARMRSRFLALRDIRLARLKATLTQRQQDFLELLPFLFHSNHPGLPGFVSRDCPADLPGYCPAISTVQLARSLNRNIELHWGEPPRGRLRGLYLMGSLGSLGQDNHSDLDVWLCHAGDLSPQESEELAAKVAKVEEYAADFSLNLNVFSMHAESFRDGMHTPISDESSGSIQHHLVLEEFYRTSILLAGLPPLWWVVPLEREADYTGFAQRLINGRFIKDEEWLDFGGLSNVPASEFLGSAHWLLHKAIQAPYKAMLKLMLTEAYAAEYPSIRWLCQDIKAAVQGGGALNPDKLDPYVMVLDRVSRHIGNGPNRQRLELARRCFYIKTGMALSSPSQSDNWRRKLLRQMSGEWGWDNGQLLLIDNRSNWKLEQLYEERASLVAELSGCYRVLNNFARTYASDCTPDARELSLIGRKLYAALEQRPGKVELLNTSGAYQLHEPRLYLNHKDQQWQLRRTPPMASAGAILKTTESLVELLAWAYLNGIADDSSSIQCPQIQQPQGSDVEHRQIFSDLSKELVPVDSPTVPLEDFAQPATAIRSLAFVNIGHDPFHSLTHSGYQRTTDRSDALSYGGVHECLVHTIDHLMLTSWGEVLVRRHTGGPEALLDMLCRHLDLTWDPHRQQPTPLQVYSHSSPKGEAIAARVRQLAEDIHGCFLRLGECARYVFQAEDQLYLVHRGDGAFQWLEVGNETDLMQMLREPQGSWRPLIADRHTMADTPLGYILGRNRRDQIQVFYNVVARGIVLYALDDSGALIRQFLPHASERHFLVQHQRFFDSLLSQQLMATTEQAARTLATRVVFERLYQERSGWTSQPQTIPSHKPGNFLDLLLITDREGPLKKGLRLQVADREFDSLKLGERLYAETARHLLQHRKGSGDYPVYLTAIQTNGLEHGAPPPMIQLLEFKHLLERRLTHALHAEAQ